MAILSILCVAAFLYQFVIFAAIIISWFPIEPGSGLERVRDVLQALTEPVLGPLRRAIPAVRLGGFALDLSPLIVLIGLSILRSVLC